MNRRGFLATLGTLCGGIALAIGSQWQKRQGPRICCYGYMGHAVCFGKVPQDDLCVKHRGDDAVLVRWDDGSKNWLPLCQLRAA